MNSGFTCSLWLAMVTVLISGTGCRPTLGDRLDPGYHDPAILAIIARATPLVRTVESFKIASGRYPRSLEELGPKWLADSSMIEAEGWSRFEYATYDPMHDKYSVRWYDLGLRGSGPTQGLWVYPYGPMDHSMLIVKSSGSGKVEEMYLDRVPDHIQDVPFTSELWNKDPACRLTLVKSLIRDKGLVCRTVADVTQLLGEADGCETFYNTPWELRTRRPGEGFPAESLAYWPTGAYPMLTWGGVKVKGWLYRREFF